MCIAACGCSLCHFFFRSSFFFLSVHQNLFPRAAYTFSFTLFLIFIIIISYFDLLSKCVDQEYSNIIVLYFCFFLFPCCVFIWKFPSNLYSKPHCAPPYHAVRSWSLCQINTVLYSLPSFVIRRNFNYFISVDGYIF